MAQYPGQWRSGGQEVYMPGSFRQPYEALAANDGSPYGSALPTMTGPANFATRYYDTGLDARSMPQTMPPTSMSQTRQDLGRQDFRKQDYVMGFENSQPQQKPGDFDTGTSAGGWSSSVASGVEARKLERRGRKGRRGSKGPPLSDYVQYCKDHMGRLFLWWGAFFVAVVAVVTAMSTIGTLLSEEFQTFSMLAWENWLPSISATMIVLAVLSICSLGAALVAFWVGWKESRPALRVFFVSSATLGIIILLMALFAYLYRGRARPLVLASANLLCQDVKPFGCQPFSTSVPPQGGAAPPAAAASENPLVAQAPATALGGRRLDDSLAAAAAAAVVERLQGRGPQPLAPQGNGSLAGRRLDTAKAALAYGTSFDHKPGIDGTSELCRTLQKLCIAPADFAPATSCVCSGAWRQEEQVAGSSEESYKAPGPWRGTQGAYCRAWSPEDQEGPWCFVAPSQTCGKGMQHSSTEAGVAMTRSSGPCGDEVQSRSLYVLDGLAAMASPLEFAAVLGCLLLTLSSCGVLLYRQPSRTTVWTQKSTEDEELGPDEAFRTPLRKLPNEAVSLEQRFDLAQRDAMRTITDATPDDMKFMLYGLYKQAKEGDIQGSRPGFFNQRERSKWDSWSQHRGKTRDEAVEGYIQAVEMLKRQSN